MSSVLIVLAKNEEHCIHLPISCVKDHVNKIVVINDASTDKTCEIASGFGAEIVQNQRSMRDDGCSEVYNWAISQVTEDWILILDADEFLDVPEKLHDLQRFSHINAWALPRRKWWSYSKLQRMEYEAYPDWQPRFFRNLPENRFKGELHKTFLGRLFKAYKGPHIEHLQEELSTDAKHQYREDLYDHLADIQDVHRERGHRRVRA